LPGWLTKARAGLGGIVFLQKRVGGRPPGTLDYCPRWYSGFGKAT